jgi:transaldolase
MYVPGTRWKILWASSREPYNFIQARRSMCDIITMTPQLISKVEQFGKSLDQFSLETVNMFYNDAKASQYTIQPTE